MRQSIRQFQIFNSSILSLVLFFTLASLHTWPLVTAPAVLSRNDHADTLLNEWTLAWVARQAIRDPQRLFDANIFYPERDTLAFSEHLILPALAVAPVGWSGGSPVLAYNLALILGFTLSGWSAYLLIRRWTGDELAGVAAGSLLAFNAHTLTRLPHVQAIHLEFVPLVVYALDRVLTERRWRDAWLLAAAMTLQGLTSIYLLVISIVAVGAGVAARIDVRRNRARGRVGVLLVVAAVATLAALIPVLVPYYRVSRAQGVTRTLDEVALYSSTWRDYLATPATIHYRLWSHRVFEGATALFPGFAALVLASAALLGRTIKVRPTGKDEQHAHVGRTFQVRPSEEHLRRVWMLVAMGAAGVLLSFGPALPGYAVLYAALPLMRAVRGAARFGFLLTVAVALLAGLGVARIRAVWPTRKGGSAGLRYGRVAAVAIIVVLNVEAFRAPIAFTPAARIPAAYDTIADEPNAVVVEFPIYAPIEFQDNARYMLSSTRHWRPLVNGYSGFAPPGYARRYEELRGFPDARATAELGRLGVTHVVVHVDAFIERKGKPLYEAIEATSALRRIALREGILLLRVRK